jgi:type II secretory ATPase GspE/PulE/Tfp pilus assembly ATPase PilB-like protein
LTLGPSAVYKETGKDLIIGGTNLSTPERRDNIVSILDYIITQSVMEGANDIHIETRDKSLRIRFRVDGILRHKTALPAHIAPSLVSRIRMLCGLNLTAQGGPDLRSSISCSLP